MTKTIDLAGTYTLLLATSIGFVAALRHGHLLRFGYWSLGTSVILLFVIVPKWLAWRWQPASIAPFLAWYAALSAFSVGASALKRGPKPDFREAIAFILVNPTLVYTQRGTRVGSPAFTTYGVTRCLEGIVLVGAATHLVPAAADTLILSAGGAMPQVVYAPIEMLVGFSMLYMQHIGLASFQIGSMSILGWSIPEQYRRPLVATSPSDFWRRWNAYLGSWLRLYVYVPSLKYLARFSFLSRAQRNVMACILTFAVTGFLHDLGAGTWASMPPPETRFFLFCGAVLVVWALIRQQMRRLTDASNFPRKLKRFAVHALALSTMAGTAWLRTAM